ncbi:MAG: GatB/YqeY domain-containing protein [Actinomycetota bacterium]|nr:GatB/YqeY domain-containing protein [Actinomycetota bacterium]
MELKGKLGEDQKSALKGGDKIKLSTIRILRSEIRNEEIKKGSELSEDETIGVLAREARKRKEAITEYQKAGRVDLVEKESKELEIIKDYMPAELSEEELRSIIADAIEETKASSKRDLGKVMSAVMPRVKGKAEGEKVNQIVREMLG